MNVVIYVAGQGIVLREPSVAAVSDDKYRDILAVGIKAREMLSKTPAGIREVHPVREGVINDLLVAEEMLSMLLAKALGRRSIIGASTSVIIGVPCSITDKEKESIQKALKNAGAKEAIIAEQPMLAAIGAKLPVNSPVGSMIVDIGGGTHRNRRSISQRDSGKQVDKGRRQPYGQRHSVLCQKKNTMSI